jgi:hypothetical protein
MKSISIHKMGLAATLAMMLLSAGCDDAGKFQWPSNTVTGCRRQAGTYYASEMSRPRGLTTKHEVSWSTTVQSKELRAKGISMFLATAKPKPATCRPHLQPRQVRAGQILMGMSWLPARAPSRQPLYELMLGKE